MKDTERRGITLRQLKDLEAFIDGHADEKGFLPGWLDRDGKTCHKDTINLYDVVKYVVNPATAAQRCSYVELVAPQGTTAQTPQWFVSHWSAGALFANKLDTHTRGRSFKSSVLLWSVRRVFCLFAVTQVRHFNGTSSRR